MSDLWGAVHFHPFPIPSVQISVQICTHAPFRDIEQVKRTNEIWSRLPASAYTHTFAHDTGFAHWPRTSGISIVQSLTLRDLLTSFAHPPDGGPALNLPLTGICSLTLAHHPAACGGAGQISKKHHRVNSWCFFDLFAVRGDSNPRYGYPYVSLANWWFKPLTHLTKLTRPNEQDCKYINILLNQQKILSGYP